MSALVTAVPITISDWPGHPLREGGLDALAQLLTGGSSQPSETIPRTLTIPANPGPTAQLRAIGSYGAATWTTSQ